MAASEASRPAGADGPDTMKLMCSHGGRLMPRGHDGAIRYAGGETRVLVVPRDVPFRELTRRLKEMAGGAEVLAVRHRLADEGLEDVLVSVTCDEELAHMRGEYDRLRATRPAARFRVFVTTAAASASSGGGVVHRGRSSAAGLPPCLPRCGAPRAIRCSCTTAPPTHTQHRCGVSRARRGSRARGASTRSNPSTTISAAVAAASAATCACPAPPPASQMNAVPYMSKKVAASPSMPAAKATRRVVFTDVAREQARSRDSHAAREGKRTIWEFE